MNIFRNSLGALICLGALLSASASAHAQTKEPTSLSSDLGHTTFTGSPSASEDDPMADLIMAVPTRRRWPSPLDTRVGLGLLARTFKYNQPVADRFSHALQPHERALFIAGLTANWYPFAHARGDALAHLGITGRFEHSLAGTTPIGAADFDTTHRAFGAGLRWRIPFGDHETGVRVGFGQETLEVQGDNEMVTIDGDRQPDPGIIPDTTYTFLKVGQDVRLLLAPFTLDAGVFLKLATIEDEPGELAEPRWFPESSATGWELDLAVSLPVYGSFSALFGTELRYFALSMNSPRSAVDDGQLNQAIAGGARDLYVSAFLGARFVLPSAR